MRQCIRTVLVLALVLAMSAAVAFAEGPEAGGGTDPSGGGQPGGEPAVCEHVWSDVWQSDETGHWHVCTLCGQPGETTPHTGGAATCTQPGTCADCGYAYLPAAGHTWQQESDADGHWQVCSVCAEKTEREAHGSELHSDANGHWNVCPTCGYAGEKTAHSGGKATCTQQAQCSVCGARYGETAQHSFTVTAHDETSHWKECSVCGEKSKVEAHSGGKATCLEKAKCSACGAVYGALGEHDFSVTKSDGSYHWKECSVCGTQGAKSAHTGGTATCTKRAECAECGTPYGERAPHTGGTATCTQKAVCDVCRSAYGDYAPHTPAAEWTSNADTHWHRCTVCNTKLEEAAHTEDSGTVMTQPTANAAGLRAYACTVCGRRVRTEYIPATGIQSAPSSSSEPASSAPADAPRPAFPSEPIAATTASTTSCGLRIVVAALSR